MKRLVSLDWMRGAAIASVVFFHALVFNMTPTTGSEDQDSVLYMVILYFITWAGFFGMISGVGNSISMYGKLVRGTVGRAAVLKGSIVRGAVILGINFFYLGILCPGVLEPGHEDIGVLPALIRVGRFFPYSLAPERLLFATALTMVAWGTIISGVLLFLLSAGDGLQRRRRNRLVITTVAAVMVWCYPLVQTLVRPWMAAPMAGWRLPGATVASWLAGPMDPIFPYVGFTLYGVVFGMMLVDGARRRELLLYGCGLGAAYSAIGIGMLWGEGFWANPFDTPDLGPVIAILGPMFMALTFLVWLMDLNGDKAKAWWARRTRGVRAFGILSLTAFVLEGPVGAVIHRALLPLMPDFPTNAGFLFLILAPAITTLWYVGLKLWARAGFVGSFEWLTVWLLARVEGRKSERLDVGAVLHSTRAYVD